MILSANPIEVNPVFFIPLAIGAIFFLVVLAVIGGYVKLWIQAYFAQADVKMFDLIGMSLRKVNAKLIVVNYIRAVHGQAAVTSRQLESHYLAGGNVEKVVAALVAARQRKVDLDFERAAAMDLGGQDPLAYAQRQPPAGAAAPATPPPVGPALLGLSARAQGPIRPAAFIDLDGQRIAALADKELIDPGTEVEIVATGQHVLVRRKRPGLGEPFSE